MKASKFSDAQKAFILKQGRDGVAVAEICRRDGISEGLSRCRVRSSRLQMNAVSGCNAHGGAPCLEGLDTEPTLRCRRDEMATDVESIVDRGMCRRNLWTDPADRKRCIFDSCGRVGRQSVGHEFPTGPCDICE